jgi:hypothetical protein
MSVDTDTILGTNSSLIISVSSYTVSEAVLHIFNFILPSLFSVEDIIIAIDYLKLVQFINNRLIMDSTNSVGSALNSITLRVV